MLHKNFDRVSKVITANSTRNPQVWGSCSKSGPSGAHKQEEYHSGSKQAGYSGPALCAQRAGEAINSHHEAGLVERVRYLQWEDGVASLKYCVIRGVKAPAALGKVFSPQMLFHQLPSLEPGQVSVSWYLSF
jgi:hypothetical protein